MIDLGLKKNYVFPVMSPSKIGSVGQLFILFFIFLLRQPCCSFILVSILYLHYGEQDNSSKKIDAGSIMPETPKTKIGSVRLPETQIFFLHK